MRKPEKPKSMRIPVALTLCAGLTLAYGLPATAQGAPSVASRLQSKDTSFQYTGKVTDHSGEALTGAVIRNVNDNTAIVADIDGDFTIKGKPGDKITISMVGFSPMDLTLGAERTLAIKLSENSEVLSEVVVVGYGTQKKISTTAAVSSLKPDEIAKKPVANITNSLAGRVAGVIAKQGSGEPGADGASLRIRGVGTLGNQDPLCVVDGVPRDFSKIDPNMIENITVLKDAAAVAPYGMAGANGVILVTTKKGSEGAPVLSYSGYVGFQNPTRITDQVNSYEYALMKNEAAIFPMTIPISLSPKWAPRPFMTCCNVSIWRNLRLNSATAPTPTDRSSARPRP